MSLLKKLAALMIALGVVLTYGLVSNEPAQLVIAGTPAPTVNPAKATSVISPQYPAGATEFRISPQGSITVKLTDQAGNALAGKTINWPSDSNVHLSTLSSITDVNGNSTVNGVVPVHAGVYRTSFTASFPGDDAYNSSTCTVTIYVYAPGTPTPRPSSTPRTFTVSGYVYDNDTTQPIAEANVITGGLGLLTDTTGYYRIRYTAYTRPSSITMTVHATGYQSQTTAVPVPTSGDTVKDFYLVPVTATPSPVVIITPTPAVTSPTPTPGWVSYIPTADQVVIKPDPTQGTVVVELTFPNAGYRVADPGNIAMSAGIYPDGSTLMTFITAGTKVERYTGVAAQLITTETITYKNLGFGTNNIFRFCVYDAPVEQIEFAGPGTGSPSPTSTATPAPTPISSLKLQFYNQSIAATSNQIYTNIKLVNTGTSAIPLSNVKLRYYYTVDGAKPQTFYCDYSPVGGSNVTGTFVTMITPKTGADTYLEVGFSSGAGNLAAGGNVTIQGRFAKNDWSNYNQSNDYSFNTTATTYVDWVKVTGYVSGALQWGTEP
jgi:hypothetical protein